MIEIFLFETRYYDDDQAVLLGIMEGGSLKPIRESCRNKILLNKIKISYLPSSLLFKVPGVIVAGLLLKDFEELFYLGTSGMLLFLYSSCAR